MSALLSKAEKRRALLFGAGSVLAIRPDLPTRQPIPRLPATSHEALVLDAVRAATDMSIAAARAENRGR